MSPERSAAEKGHGVGEKEEGASSIILGPGGAAPGEYSPAQPSPDAGSATLLEQRLSLRSQCGFQEPPPSQSSQQDLPWVGGGELCTNPSSFSAVAALLQTPPEKQLFGPAFFPPSALSSPFLSIHHNCSPPGASWLPQHLHGRWLKDNSLVRVKIFGKESEAGEGRCLSKATQQTWGASREPEPPDSPLYFYGPSQWFL